MYAPHALQVLDCAVLLTSWAELHSKQRAVRWRGLLLRNDSIFCLNPLLSAKAADGVGSAEAAARKPRRDFAAGAVAGGVLGPTTAAAVMAKY